MNPTTLVFYLAPRWKYRPVIISENEIFCGATEPDHLDGPGPKTLNIPTGNFDIDLVLKKLPPEMQPELLVIKADGSRRLAPRRLDRLSCPKVLVSGDTHHMARPLSFMLTYAQQEKFDYIITDHDRHHLHFYHRIGYRKLLWIPALNYRCSPRPILSSQKKAAIFVGQLGKYHPYRRDLFNSLIENGLPLETQLAHPDDTPDLYSKYPISLNCSLNADLNLRVFEIMSSGGFLLTDRLAPQSGLQSLFEEGKHFEGYADAGELQEKVRHFLDNPQAALDIRKNGLAEIQRAHLPEKKAEQLLDFVFSEKAEEPYRLEDPVFKTLIQFPPAALPSQLGAYEALQDLHLNANAITLFTHDGACPPWVSDLHRIQGDSHEASANDLASDCDLLANEPRVLMLGEDIQSMDQLVALLNHFIGEVVINASPRLNHQSLATVLERFGFTANPSNTACYQISNHFIVLNRWIQKNALIAVQKFLLSPANNQLPIPTLSQFAQIGLTINRLDLCKHFLAVCIRKDRNCQHAYLSLASLFMQEDQLPSAFLHYKEAEKISAIDKESAAQLQTLEQNTQTLEDPDIAAYLEKSNRPHGSFYREYLPLLESPSIALLLSRETLPLAKTLLKSAALLHRQGLSCQLHFLHQENDPELETELGADIEKTNAAPYTSFSSAQTSELLMSTFALCNIFINTSSSESTFPASAEIATQAGLALLQARSENVSRSLIDGHNGALFDSAHENEIAKRLSSLCSDPAKWESLIHTARS